MSRGRAHDEMEFGSDSFLDVVANIVGILIILIVVAGIRAGTSPVTAEHVAAYLRAHAKGTAAPPARAPGAASESAPVVVPVSADVARKAESLRTKLASTRKEVESGVAALEGVAQQESALKRRVEEAAKSLEVASAELARKQQEAIEAKSRLAQLRTGLLQVETDIKQAQQTQPPTKRIEHQLTPLSREIQGKEIHFRLLGNKVAYLPIEELMSRLKTQITEHKARLIREGAQEGQVGPVHGFRMDYIVRVQHLSVIDELRSGSSMTIGVNDWRLVPEPDLDQEGPDEALRDGSDFLRILRMADPDTTITFWVYPDSFPIYRRLQAFAHRENYTVAARPLPHGVPIAGSPHGTRSSGQ